MVKCVCVFVCAYYRRFRTMEAAANKLQKEAKGYLDALRGGPPYSLSAPAVFFSIILFILIFFL